MTAKFHFIENRKLEFGIVNITEIYFLTFMT